MASSFTLYGKYHYNVGLGYFEHAVDTLKLALLTSAYTPSVNVDAVFADVSANEIAAANGYSSGGASLTGVTWTYSGGIATLSAADTVWTASGGSIAGWRYAVLYAAVTRTINSAQLVNPLIGYMLGDTTPADIPANSVGLRVRWNTNGIFTQ